MKNEEKNKKMDQDGHRHCPMGNLVNASYISCGISLAPPLGIFQGVLRPDFLLVFAKILSNFPHARLPKS